MYSYSATQWLCFFYLYCFVGWCFESTYVSIRKHKPVNRGFMRGPYLPLYGSGAIVMLFVSLPFRNSLILTFLAGSIGATILEYVTGVVMEALFKVRYWDYSDQKLNFQGHICLSSSIAWGVLTIFLTRVLHKPVEKLVTAIPEQVLTPCTYLVTVIVAVDFALSVKAALDLRDVLLKLEKAKRDMELLQKRLDVMIAFAEDAIEKKRQERSIRSGELIGIIEERFEKLREVRGKDMLNGELAELRERFVELKSKREQLRTVENGYRKHLLIHNPSMHSERFREALDVLKQSAEEHDKRRGKIRRVTKNTEDMFFSLAGEYLPDSDTDKMKLREKQYPKTFLVCMCGRKVVGVAYGWPRALDAPEDTSFVLDGIAVEEGFQKKGYGTKLLRAFEKNARRYGFSSVSLGSAGGKTEKFYLKNGYIPTEYKVIAEDGTHPVKAFEGIEDYECYERPQEDGFVVMEKRI